MTTRTQLEKTLAAQRARRMKHSTPANHRKDAGLLNLLMAVVILAASGIAMYFAVSVTDPINVPAIASPSASPPLTSISITAPPAAMQVCTDIPNGRLHVRFAAGEGSEVRGYLVEGEAVQLAPVPDGQMIQGDLWLPITSPVTGWVNARYVCKQEK